MTHVLLGRDVHGMVRFRCLVGSLLDLLFSAPRERWPTSTAGIRSSCGQAHQELLLMSEITMSVLGAVSVMANSSSSVDEVSKKLQCRVG